MRASCVWLGPNRAGWVDAAIGIPLGFATGFIIASWLSGYSLVEVIGTHPQSLVVSASTALLFGALGSWHFYGQARLLEARALAQAEAQRRAEGDAALARAELTRLQAQIEPHFLFNTLSNVIGLIDTNPGIARTMLIDLTSLLRTSLTRTRRGEVTLGEELDVLRAYLGIMAVRMGERLDWRVDAAPELLGLHLPPLLVQPLVENAIRHGLEPKPAGGHLAVSCRRDGDGLLIEVADDGQGFGVTSGDGVGLANVRERLNACYGERARLTLASNALAGVTARLHIPAGLACA